MAINRANGGITGVRNQTSGGGNTITTIKTSGKFRVQTGTNEVDVLVVAGGGGGGKDNGGGGGAGGFQSFTNQKVQPNSDINVTIGAGGAGSDASPATSAGAGTDTVFANPISSLTSAGGGFGGSNGIAPGPGNGLAGGSGGGVGGGTTATAGAAPDASQGNAGGAAGNDAGPAFSKCGGGGGGAGAAGTAGNNAAGFGGIGAPSTITGTDTLFAGGGGGGNENSNNNSAGGGIGGGGRGAVPNATAGVAGTTSTGSGGGGGQGSGDGGAGGSGLVIVKEKDKAGGMFNMNSQYNSVKSGQWPTVNIYDVTNSCRYNNGDSPKLSKTLTAPNQKTFTISMWVKLGDLAGNMGLWTLGKALTGESGDYTTVDVKIGSAGRLALNAYDGVADATRAAYNTASTGPLYRDLTSWYHFVYAFDSTDPTGSDRLKYYVNGVDETSNLTASTTPAQDVDFFNPTGSSIEIGYQRAGNAYFDGYIAEFNYVDGQQLHCGNFGEPDPDNLTVWRPKNYEGSHGDNGVKLEFKQTGTSANSSGIGADTSGNDNHQTVTNLAAIDIVEDVPSNNFCTGNPLDVSGVDNPGDVCTFSEGNNKIVQAGSNNVVGWKASTIGIRNGKWYFELKLPIIDYQVFGVGDATWDGQDGAANNQFSVYIDNGTETFRRGAGVNAAALNVTSANNDIWMFALDLDSPKLWIGHQGTWLASGDPAAGSNPMSTQAITDTLFIGGSLYTQNDSQILINTGNPPFAISSSQADDNGYGNFEYDVPAGFYSINTKNLAQYG